MWLSVFTCCVFRSLDAEPTEHASRNMGSGRSQSRRQRPKQHILRPLSHHRSLGEVVVEAGESEALLSTTVDLALVDEIRSRIPVLADRRPACYSIEAECVNK